MSSPPAEQEDKVPAAVAKQEKVLAGIRAEDVLPDGQDFLSKPNNPALRKGSVAAALLNADVLLGGADCADSNSRKKEGARVALKELMPVLLAVGFGKHLTWKNPEIQRMMEECERKMDGKSNA